MKKLLLLNLMMLLMSWDIHAQTATPPALGDGSVDHPYEIATLENLYWIGASDAEIASPSQADRFAAYYIQTADIDASETAEWCTGGWSPIGETDFDELQFSFKGNYNGKGHTISGLTITDSSHKFYGLFCYAYGAVFQNLGVTDVYINVEGTTRPSGALLGYAHEVQINNCYSTGVVKGNDYTGGLVGCTIYSTITDSYSTCEVSGGYLVGGLVGDCNAGNSIINCFHTTGVVKGDAYTGGLTGWSVNDSKIMKCYSTGEVQGRISGGLAGENISATISDCYSRCIVSTSDIGGGLVGENYFSAIIDNCYSTGSVGAGVGGLVGDQDDGSITSNSFWDIETSGTSTSAAGEGKNTTDMKTQSTFTDAGWDFSTIWGINVGCNDGYPCLRQGFPPLVNITCDVSGEICSNMEPIFTATPFGADGGNVSYQWKLNGESAGLNQNLYTLVDLVPGYVYKVSCEITVTNITNCESASATSEKITISVSPLPDAGEITGNNVILVGETTSLSSNEPGGFWLSDEDDLDVATVDAATGIVTGISVGTATIYYYKEGIVSECYNFGRSEFQVTVCTQPSGVIVESNSPVCEGDNIELSASVSEGSEPFTYSWTGPDGFTSEEQIPVITNSTLAASGTYSVTATNGCGSVTGSVEVTLMVSPTATAPAIGDGTEGNPYQIATLENLYWIAENSLTWDKYFIQTADIDASATAEWCNGGWLPIGETDFNEFQFPFKGNYNGKGHTISGLTITITGDSNKFYGLFGYAEGAVFQNLGVTDVSINVEGSSRPSGALLGGAKAVQINNCYSTGVVKGNDFTGGLAGSIRSSIVTNCFSTCEVSGDDVVGGLVGDCNSGNSIINCWHTTGTVRGDVSTGGLTGSNSNCQMSLCYSTGEVFGGDFTGGLVGDNWTSSISDCYCRCNVLTSFRGGGLVGYNSSYATVTNCYSTGSVTVIEMGGGLVGIQNENATTTYSFWDMETSGTESSADGEGKTTAEMKTLSTFTDAGWDFTSIWGMNAGCNDGYPCLRQGFLPLVNITCDVSEEICSNMEPTFTATPFGTDGGNVSYQWKLNGNSVGQNQNSYTLKDLKPGYVYKVSCEITVTNITNCESASATSEEITLSVAPRPDAGVITVKEGDNEIQVGESTQLSSTVEGGSWLSADETIATIDEYGHVTGTGVGETTIGYVVIGDDPCNEVGWTEFSITVVASSGANTPPEISDIVPSTTDPIAVSALFSVTVSYSDVDDNIKTAVIDWGDGLPTTDILSQADDETYSNTYSNAGVYTVTVSVNDGYGPVTKTYQYVVVYDPSEGFVTGGGWIESPICVNVDPAYDYMDVSGTANFGFVAKYQKGKVTPDGSTEFQFKAGGLNFKSTEYEWLIIAGSKAMYKGSGTINGSGDFGFMLSAIDGDLTETPGDDLFRIKIWDKNNENAVVYDNQCGADDYANLDQTTAIAGGSIVIHSADNKSKSAEIIYAVTPEFDEVNLTVYPNPFSEKLNFEFVSPEDGTARIDIYDLSGRLIKTVFNNRVVKDVTYKPAFNPELTVNEIFIYRMIFGGTVLTGKAIYKK
ncbi:PKD domain-containing protein [Prolixibacteraceae bacterium Z1-6]|uniref:PKD domain-containing protein n=1 Tax=Draconibacterium aestuarii TaxID=2998507 RepID=A0A9X3F1P1_9BACT|nr:PKD domain-containing protein [Prolixibacteraceae bacterium Z1-6]